MLRVDQPLRGCKNQDGLARMHSGTQKRKSSSLGCLADPAFRMSPNPQSYSLNPQPQTIICLFKNPQKLKLSNPLITLIGKHVLILGGPEANTSKP